jgi:hypothetical protein
LFEALKSHSSGWSGLTLSAARYSMTRHCNRARDNWKRPRLCYRVFQCLWHGVLVLDFHVPLRMWCCEESYGLMLLLRYVGTVRPNLVRACTLVR